MGRPKGLRLNPDALEAILKLSGPISMSELSSRSSVPLSTIWALANEPRGASERTARKLASGLRVKPGALFPELIGAPEVADEPATNSIGTSSGEVEHDGAAA